MDSNGLYDIYPVWHIPFWQTNWFFWGCLGLLTALILIAVYAVVRWYSQRSLKALTPWQKASHTIGLLQKRTFETQQQAKQGYAALTDCIKRYLHERFGYPIAHATDEEAAQFLETADDVTKQISKRTQELLRAGLLIKFANEQALNEEIHTQLTFAQDLIRETTPPEKSAS